MSKATTGRLSVVGRRKLDRKPDQTQKQVDPSRTKSVVSQDIRPRLIAGLVIGIAGAWAYLSTLQITLHAWETEPDYSHGYLVVPAALYFLWTRRNSRPELGPPSWLTGLSLVTLSICFRLIAGTYYLESLDGWSMIIWLAGVVALLFGNATLRWALPSIAFLVFMIPIPFRFEGMLSLPLQQIATKASSWTLQLIGQPAIAEGNTILLGDHRLEVERACSGLRLFVSILALAFAYLQLVKRRWWEMGLLLVSVVPIAIVANTARIVATGLLYEYASTEAAKKFSHDFAGWAMIPLAAALFGLVLWYLRMLVREHEEIALSKLVRRAEI